MRDLPIWAKWIVWGLSVLTALGALYTFYTDNVIKRTVRSIFAPQINIEQNLSPDALRELQKNSPDGTIRIEKGITINPPEENNAENPSN
jgi:hypothetical protein